MAKMIEFDTNARNKLKEGVDKLADAVKVEAHHLEKRYNLYFEEKLP